MVPCQTYLIFDNYLAHDINEGKFLKSSLRLDGWPCSRQLSIMAPYLPNQFPQMMANINGSLSEKLYSVDTKDSTSGRHP
jgi:hypothetical protein